MPPLFVYGTLLPGACNPWSRLLWSNAADLGPAIVPGRLFDLGPYPAFLDPSAQRQLVHGRLARIACQALFAQLDEYEGGEYQRVLRQAALTDGRILDAWVYLYQLPAGHARLIPDGRWPLQ